MSNRSVRQPWAERLRDRITQQRMRRLVYHTLAAINSPRALSIFMIMKNSDATGDVDDEVLLLKADPFSYQNARDFWGAYAPTELIRKFMGLRLSVDPRATARESFIAAEVQCRATNVRLRSFQDPTGRYEPLMDRMRKNLEEMLGPVSVATLERCVEDGGWGKGVTSSCKGKWLSEYHKLAATPQATRTMGDLARAYWRDAFPSDTREIEWVRGSSLSYVPKNATTERTICVEPSVNSFFQRGIGKRIKYRMRRRWGIDLGDQSRNQKLARKGSIDDSLATIDIRSASDTVSMAVVERLLPEDWVVLLKAPRCGFVYDSERKENIFLHKWSSMGNGYTFELETAIFAAAVKSVISREAWVSGEWSVYGDDIIVPSQNAEELCQFLGHLGFSPNSKKTFTAGPFRESCGADYYLGVNVRPFYLKRVDWIQAVELTNWIRSEMSAWCPDWESAWNSCVKTLEDLVPLGPAGPHGLAVIWANPDELKEVVPTRNGLVHIVTGYSWVAREVLGNEVADDIAAMYAHLRSIQSRPDSHLGLPLDLERLSEPWRLTATGVGKWERKRSVLAYRDAYWLPSVSRLSSPVGGGVS